MFLPISETSTKFSEAIETFQKDYNSLKYCYSPRPKPLANLRRQFDNYVSAHVHFTQMAARQASDPESIALLQKLHQAAKQAQNGFEQGLLLWSEQHSV